MEYIKLENLSKSYGEKVLFSDLNYTLNQNDRVAIIAKNGNGKSTLLRIIAGEESSDGVNSRVVVNKSAKLYYLEQEPVFDSGQTLMDCLFSLDNEAITAIKNYEQALKSKDNKVIQEAISRMEDAKAWDIESRMKQILYKLNLRDLEQNVSILSGGQQKRLAIARMVLMEPDIVLLDEPTNHLDIEMIEWLEAYLLASSMTILMVTHDRYFMERICDSIIELDNGSIYKYEGNYTAYLTKKAIQQEIEKVSHAKAKKLYLKELDWVRRQPQARGTKAKSRIHEYDKLKDHISSITYDDVFEIEIDATRLGKKIVEFYDAGKAFGELTMLKHFWYKFRNGEKIGICGPNGSGKTTLVNLITGTLLLDSGKRVIGETVRFGHYRQDGLSFKEDQRIIDVIREVAEYIPLKKGYKLSAERLLENFMFDRKQQGVKVSQLSGGERKRLHLLKVLMSNPNFLILDEPTNDLDVLTLNVLEEYLSKFPGCVLIVTHDRYFMDKIVDHLFILKGGGEVQDFNGSYSAWREKDKIKISAQSRPKPVLASSDTTSNPARKLSYNEKREIQNLEKKIATLESRKKEIGDLFLSDTGLEGNQIEDLSIELGKIDEELDVSEMRWLELSELA